MNNQWKWIGMIVIIAVLLAGCSSAVQTQQTATDSVKITFMTNPAPSVVGKNEIVLEVQDNKGQPLTGANVDVSADHTDMSGMTMGGAATEQGNGKYAITADFSMSGTWKITVIVQKESLDFKKDFELKIP
jgi:uncharacterized GH25 family protein